VARMTVAMATIAAVGMTWNASDNRVTPMNAPSDAAPLGCIGIGAVLVAIEPHRAERAAAAPFAHDRPVAEQGRHDVDYVEAVDVSGRVGAGQERHLVTVSTQVTRLGRNRESSYGNHSINVV
jgi:hypothetical protein